MTTTVGTLLDDVHARAWDLCSELSDRRGEDGSSDRALELLAAWPQLARSALRVLDAVGVEPAWLDDLGSVRLLLAEVGRGMLTSPGGGGPEPSSAADPAVVEVATRLGLIADLLADERPARTEVDRNALAGLQANVVTVVHAVAAASVAALEDQRDLQQPRSVLREVATRTERFAMVPAARRRGRYDDVGAVRPDGSLDAALSNWARASIDLLTSRRRVSQSALQVAAGDTLILTATAGTVWAAACQLGLAKLSLATATTTALREAHVAWRRPASWPATVRLEGIRDPEHIHASRQLRQLITDSLRQGRDWLPAETMAQRFDVPSLLATMRRGLHAAGNVAVAHFQALDTLVRGPGRLWIAATAVTQPAYRGAATVQAALRHGWVLMPPGEPAGRALHADAMHALTMTTKAIAALDRTAASAAATPPGSIVGWERDRIVARATAEQPLPFEIVRTSAPDGAKAEQRTPTPLSRRRPDLGPRR
ncbi:MAG: hypothetical protein WAZ15_11710 [Propioniciclava sp.]|jgi:hypothetical protein